MFELHITQNKISDSSTSISWCVDKELLKFLADSDITDPQVVICVAPVGDRYGVSKEHRKVVPLKDLIAYVELHSSGKNNIWAFISTTDRKSTRSVYLAKYAGSFESTLLNSSGDSWKDSILSLEKLKTLYSDPLEVDVPATAFAKEPPQWEQVWVNHFFNLKVANQCDYRRRRLFAYTLQPLIMVLTILVRVFLLATSLLWLSKGASLKYIVHPLRYSLNDVGESWAAGSWAIRETDYDFDENPVYYILARCWAAPLMPIVMLALFVCYKIPFIIGIMFITLMVILLVVCAAALTFGKGYLYIFDWFYAKFLADKEAWYLNSEEQDLLVCDGNKSPLTMQNLPFKKKTIKLRFMDLKSKVCKPFSR